MEETKTTKQARHNLQAAKLTATSEEYDFTVAGGESSPEVTRKATVRVKHHMGYRQEWIVTLAQVGTRACCIDLTTTNQVLRTREQAIAAMTPKAINEAVKKI